MPMDPKFNEQCAEQLSEKTFKPKDYSSLSAGLDDILQGFLRKHALAVEELTEQQMATALRQAIECGDFIRQVRVTDNGQNVIYIPYARECELDGRILRLEEALKRAGVADPDKLAFNDEF